MTIQKKRPSNAVPLSSFYGMNVGDKLRPGADLSQVGTTISEHEIETEPHPSTDGKSAIFTFHGFIEHAKNWVARLDGFEEDPIKARTSYKHGLRVDKDPRKRTIIAYSKALEYAESPEGKAAKAEKQQRLANRHNAKLARAEKKKAKLVAQQEKQQAQIAKLEAQLAKAKGNIAAPAESPAPVESESKPQPAPSKVAKVAKTGKNAKNRK